MYQAVATVCSPHAPSQLVSRFSVCALLGSPFSNSLPEYVGELVSWESIRLYIECYTKWDLNYVFSLSKDVFVDATEFGNMARFINSSNGGGQQNCAANFRQVKQFPPQIGLIYHAGPVYGSVAHCHSCQQEYSRGSGAFV